MRDIVASLDGARQALDDERRYLDGVHDAGGGLGRCLAARSRPSSGKVADRVGTAQRDMAEMAKAVAQLSEQVGTVWDNYRTRFEKVDDELQAVFERLQGGTRAFGEDVMDFVGKLDTSLANGMQAFSLGTEELREVAQLLVVGVDAKAA